MKSRQVKAAKSSPRRREQKLHRQEAILAAAFEVFAAHGYEAARIDEVARRAGIAKGTIYLYFTDKERLFRAMVRSLVQKRFDAVAGSFHGTAEQLLRELLSRMYSQVVRNEKVRSIVRLLIAEGGRFPQLTEIYHREIIAPGMNAVRQGLLQGIASGEFRKTAAVEFPQLLAAPGILAIVWRLLHGERHRLDLDAYSKAHLEFILGSLRKQPD
ncbi:MAG: TetR/AcrR family transcriptional regulator [Terriglobia bacterium]|jgi:AcrR family transcriptional regulator